MLSIETAGRVARVTLERPRARNALSSELVRRLGSTLRELDADPSAGAVVLAGSPPGFCAGSDLKELAGMDVAEMSAHESETGAMARGIAQLGTPVVAAVEGFALGGGFVLAASCDLVVTGRGAAWHLPEVSLGWVPPWGLQALAARVGPVAARRLAWGAEPVDGTEAHRQGLADELAEDGEAVAAAGRLAGRLAAMPASAVASTKRAFAALASGGGEALDAEANRLFVSDCNDDRARESLARFRGRQ
jgi:enoyl-CoA hydratase/carnithine racemase